MKKRSFVGMIAVALMTVVVGCSNGMVQAEGPDLKPVIYLYPQQDGTEITVKLDYNGSLTTLDPAFNTDNGWTVVANTNGQITLGEKSYNYLYWEGNPNNQYDFYSGFCIKGSDTESFLRSKLPYLGLNDSETNEFINYWLPMMKDNKYNVISFQEGAYTGNAKLDVTPKPDSIIRVFMAWYPSDKEVKILPQDISGASRSGFSVVEWGGNKVK
ncbi:MAG: hypothetical protein II842_15520 [Butyrivibrio sp.]|nr:hypothetical protein [Butyrivibrio sp.]